MARYGGGSLYELPGIGPFLEAQRAGDMNNIAHQGALSELAGRLGQQQRLGMEMSRQQRAEALQQRLAQALQTGDQQGALAALAELDPGKFMEMTRAQGAEKPFAVGNEAVFVPGQGFVQNPYAASPSAKAPTSREREEGIGPVYKVFEEWDPTAGKYKEVSRSVKQSSGTNVTIGMPKPEAEARKLLSKSFMDEDWTPTIKAGTAAVKQNFQLEALRRLPIIDKTNWAAPIAVKGAQILNAFGVAPEQAKQYAADAELFTSILGQQVWTLLEAQKGVQTEGDAQRAKDTFAQLGNTPQGNKFIISLAMATNNMAKKKADFYRRNEKDAYKEADLASIGRKWMDESAKPEYSIWSDPVMKEFNAARPAASAPSVRDQADAILKGVPGGNR